MNFDFKRIALYVVFAFFASQLWVAWQQEQAVVQQQQATTQASQATAVASPDLPSIQASASSANASEAQGQQGLPETRLQPTPSSRLVWVETDVLRIAIDKQGGSIVRSELLQYPESVRRQSNPVQILSDNPNELYIAQSGLLSQRGPDKQSGQAMLQSSSNHYALKNGENVLDVRLSWRDSTGVMVDKVYTFTRGSYLIDVKYDIENRSSQPWVGNFYTQFKRQDVTPKKQGMFYINPYRGGSYSNPDNKIYNKLTFKKMGKSDLQEKITGGWVAMQQHYFLSAWVPPSDAKLNYYSQAPKEKDSDKEAMYYLLGMYTNALEVPSNQRHSVASQFYVGPELTDSLKQIAPGLNMTVDYGMLWPISMLIMWLMKYINLVVDNWGWSILLVTLLIKLLFYRLSSTTYKSMARQKELAPRIEQLKKRFGDDKQGFSQAMIELYRKEKVNPLGGCLPMLVQIPVFIALYWVLVESVEFRQAPFILWIHDLSMPDPYYLLPLVMGLTMFIQQKLNPPPPDPMQQKMLMALPVVFTVLFLYFPAGLVLYFTANNALSVLQQWYVMRHINANKKPGAAPVSS